jgi:hypothetical protein
MRWDPQNNTKAAEEIKMKPIELSQETPRRDRVGGQRRPTLPIVATLGGLAVAASMATMTLVAFHHNPDASTQSPAAVIRADPSSPPPPGATGNPDQQPRHVCTHWDPKNNTTQDEPCDSPS